MIRGVHLLRFRGHESLDLTSLGRVAVLVGRNNAGKSAILQAIAWAKYRDAPLQNFDLNRELFYKASGTAEVHIDFGGADPSTGTKTASVNIRSNPPGRPTSSPNGAVSELAPNVYFVGGPREAVPQYQFSEFGRDVGLAPERPWQMYRELRDVDEDAMERINSWGSRIIGGVDKIRSPSMNAVLGTTRADTYGYPVRLFVQGSGIGSVLPIVIQGILCPEGSTILVDEPELHLHRAAIDSLVDFFTECAMRNVQTICTTQSVDFVSAICNSAFVSNLGDAKFPPPGSFSLHEIVIGSGGRTSAQQHDPAKDETFVKVRSSLAWGV